MNVYAETNSYGYGGPRQSPPAPSPNGKTLVQGYRNDIITGFQKDPPRYNPSNTQRPQSSVLVDLKDPIQVHLLTETALTDSKKYEILSQEEVDALKKQCQSLTQRVESTRANLTIQSKYRDAAISMARLYAPVDGKRRSLLGRHSGDIQSAREAEAERQASERKCEELAAELFNLEKRLMEPQRRLLEHTAGILQLTHKASKRKNLPPPGQPINGMPGSPESLYTYSRNSMDQTTDEAYFDDTSMYQFDQLDGFQSRSQPRKPAIEIPLKSPIREQTSQLREEMDHVRNENAQLHTQTDSLVRSISEMEQRLENLNGSLRDAIVRFDPAKNSEYLDVPYPTGQRMEPGEMLRNQMDYLETGLFAIQAEQESFPGSKEVEQRIDSLNRQVREILLTVDPEYPAAPDAPQDDVEEQFAYIEDSLRVVDAELERAVQAANRAANTSSSRKQDSDQIEVVLMGLWDIIQSGFASIKQQKEERRKARHEKGLEEDESMSEDEGFDTEEQYTLNGFSARVQWLYRQATTLKDQKSVLKRQIKQQRELNNKSDAEKDEELQRRQEELEQTQDLLDRAEKESMDAQRMLSEALEDLEEVREAAGAGGAAQAQLQQRNAAIAALEVEVVELQQNLDKANAAQAQLEEQSAKALEERNTRVTALEADVRHFQQSLAAAGTDRTQLDERSAKVTALEAELKQLQESLATATATSSELEERNMKVKEERNAKIAALEADLKQFQQGYATRGISQLDERNNRIAALQAEVDELQENLTEAEAVQDKLAERNTKIAALEADVKQLQVNLAAAETNSQDNQGKLASVDSMIAALNMQLDETERSKTKAQDSVANLQKQVDAQREELTAKQKSLKVMEDELELQNMNMVELKTELTIAQAELDGAYGSRSERAAQVAAIKTSAEVVKLQNQVTKLKKELTETVQELEDVTRETLGAEREKIELEAKLDDAAGIKTALEGELNSLREHLEAEINKAREHISKLQEQLDAERLKAGPGNSGRPGAGATMLSEQFRATMREERKKFQEEVREERARSRKLEEELARLKRAQGPGRSPLGPLSPR
ncbi:Fc.00g015190.m01.CDS01 [Cosmosporella sp. VM-42]